MDHAVTRIQLSFGSRQTLEFAISKLEAFCHDGLHLLQPGFRYGQRILLPVVAIEELERQEAAEAGQAQIAEDFLQRRHAVTGIDTMRIADRRAVRLGRIIVDMKYLDRRPRQQLQSLEIRASFVEMINVGKDARFWMPAFDGH